MTSKAAFSRKEQVYNEALGLFRENGYRGTSVRDIAHALQIEAASLYNHISGKEEILQNTCFSMAQLFDDSIAEVNDLYFNAAERLGWAVKNHVNILCNNMDAAFVFIHEWRNLSEPFKSNFISRRKNYETQIHKILADGKNEGIFNEVDNKFAVLTVLSSINFVVEWYKPNGSMSPNQIAEKLTEFILTGLKKHQ